MQAITTERLDELHATIKRLRQALLNAREDARHMQRDKWDAERALRDLQAEALADAQEGGAA